MIKIDVILAEPGKKANWQIWLATVPRVGEMLEDDPLGVAQHLYLVTRVHYGMSFGNPKVFVEEVRMVA